MAFGKCNSGLHKGHFNHELIGLVLNNLGLVVPSIPYKFMEMIGNKAQESAKAEEKKKTE